jgi:hypothetical protein
MKKLTTLVLAGALCLTAGCEDFLDVNTNPNAPERVAPNLYLPPLLHWMATSPQFDGRFIGRYTQQWKFTNAQTAISTWDRMGYDPGSDNGGQLWRDVYWTFGHNLIDMISLAEEQERWDLLGVGLILKAWGWQMITDVHGEIIIQEAFDVSRFTFNYDSQEFAYQEVKRLLDSAIVVLKRTDGNVDAAYLSRGDKIYNGDRTKWLKFAYGLRAIHLNHYSNKASYNPDAVIANVDSSFASNADDALLTYPNTNNDDINFWGRTRNNLTNYRQTQFVVNLMNGTAFDSVVDPRMSRMLAPSPDGQYRGVDINVVAYGGLAAAQQPNNFFGYVGTGGLGLPGRYLFDDRAKMPIMTYAQLQFVKAEAALLDGNHALAHEAYVKGVSAHIDFVNARNLDANQSPSQITAAEKAAFLASPAIVPPVGQLTLSHILSQKYIAQFGWAHVELWLDMRRYDYTDLDPVSGEQIFRGFAFPTTFYGDNANKPAERIRPRYNSEYVWNQAGLEPIGGLATDFHTKPMWITEP